MPANKSALLRYRIIDGCLTNTLRRYPTIEQIREKIEDQLGDTISISMINKDLAEMKRIYGAPIRFDRQHGGYGYTESDFSIKEFPLLEEEITALDYSTALLQQIKGSRLFEHFESAINKVIEGYRVSKIIGKSEKQLLQVEEPVKNDTTAWLEPLLKAITEQEPLLIHYKAFDKNSTHHNFSPYALKEYRNRWYAVGFSAQTDRIIILALDRIALVEKREGKYISSEAFNPSDFFRYSFGITTFSGTRPERVQLQFTPLQANYIITQPMHASQKILRHDRKGMVIELEVYLSQELLMTILSFGRHVKVLGPAKLSRLVQKEIAAMAAMYT